MIGSHDFSRRAARGVTVALQAAGLLIACATAVEEPASTTQGDHGSLVSSSGGTASTVNSSSSATSTNASTTSGVSATGTLGATTTSATSGEAATSSSNASSNTTSTSASSTTTATATLSTSTTSSVTSTSTSSSSAGGASGVTTGSFATTVTGDSTLTTASTANSTTGASTEFCEDALTPAENVASEGTTGAFETMDGVCYKLDFVPAAFAGWGCSNFQASAGNRTITVNGAAVTCGELPLPEPIDGGYYFDFGPGTNVSAAMYWWNWE